MGKERLPVSNQIAYSFGEAGKAMLQGITGTYLIYFYIPTVESGIAVYVPQGCFLGFITTVGIISMAGKLFDAFIDPYIAGISDRYVSERGRRIPFMRWAAFPYALFTLLIFCCPIKHESCVNSVYLGIMLLLYYVFVTMYSAPYNALLSELGSTSEQKINLSTGVSIAWGAGFGVSSQAPLLWGWMESFGADKTSAVRIAFGIIAILGLVCLMVPVVTIDEKRYCEDKPSTKRTSESVRAALSCREFRFCAISNLFYGMGNGVFQSSALYYITVLLGKSEEYLGSILIWGGAGTLLFYYPVNVLSKRYGKKRFMIAAFCMYIFLYVYGFFLGKYPLAAEAQKFILIGMAAPPTAIFGILPNALLADIVQYNEKETGESRAAVFASTRAFISKLGHVGSNFIVSALLLIKRNGTSELGIRLTSIAAAVFSLLGLIFIMLYDEKKVLTRL